MAPTQVASPASLPAPIAATPLPANPENSAEDTSTAAHVTCTGGMLQVKAHNSSLNGILRAISRCTGMHITGGIPEQRVFGDYGPAAPATVLATLIDGSSTNMLLRETMADQPAELILTPRTGGPTPPPASSYNDADEQAPPTPPASFQQPGIYQPAGGARQPQRMPMAPGSARGRSFESPYAGPNGTQTPVPQPYPGSPVTNPPSLPMPRNDVNGSPQNISPTAGSYPTTHSVPLDSVATPSTTPSSNGLVDAPNPPTAGSDTAVILNGAPRSTTDTSPNSSPAAPGNQAPSTELTPEQVFQQLQQRQQQQQQRQQQQQSPQD